MSDDRLPATEFKSGAGNAAAGHTASHGEVEQTRARAAAATTRGTVGVYERPAQRRKVSLPLIVIVILATLISLVLTARFLF